MQVTERLNKMAKIDKQNNPKYLTNVLKSDFFYLINNYFEVPFEDIDIEINLEEEKYNIKVVCKGDRLKTFRALPD